MADYTGCSDEELIVRLRNQEAGIMDYILDKYKPLVRKRANALYLIGGDTDDLIQEGMIGLFKAIQDYQPDRDSSFYHFARLCVERQMYTAVEASRRKKHAPLNSYISLYDDFGTDGVALADVLAGGADKNPECLLIDQERVQQMLDALAKNLSPMEKQVFDYMREGFHYRQIAEIMEQSPKAIDNAIQRMRRKIEKIHIDNMEKL
ncbi:MAG: sigma-70 family RNA polymerase sigma factor [Lachnospiraceae bacterium]|nr:sigma-70 family RNA polymerase sigma factor [Lachnospiraceae bacterium]